MSERTLVYYTGAHLGARPRSVLHRTNRDQHVTWDRPVKAVPEADAEQLLRTPESFVPALPLGKAAQRLGISAARLEELGEAGVVHVETYQARGEEPETVLVLDELTREGIAEERSSRSSSSEEPDEEGPVDEHPNEESEE